MQTSIPKITLVNTHHNQYSRARATADKLNSKVSFSSNMCKDNFQISLVLFGKMLSLSLSLRIPIRNDPYWHICMFAFAMRYQRCQEWLERTTHCMCMYRSLKHRDSARACETLRVHTQCIVYVYAMRAHVSNFQSLSIPLCGMGYASTEFTSDCLRFRLWCRWPGSKYNFFLHRKISMINCDVELISSNLN